MSVVEYGNVYLLQEVHTHWSVEDMQMSLAYFRSVVSLWHTFSINTLVLLLNPFLLYTDLLMSNNH